MSQRFGGFLILLVVVVAVAAVLTLGWVLVLGSYFSFSVCKSL